MKQKLCIVFGVAMIAFVGLITSGAIGARDQTIKSVSPDEAKLVTGGGQYGTENAWHNGYYCGGGPLTPKAGCSGQGIQLWGNAKLQGWILTGGQVPCGGMACSTSWYNPNPPGKASE